MREPDHTVMFGVQVSDISETPKGTFSSSEIEVNVNRAEDGLIYGEYKYESEPLFGSSTEAEGFIIFDKNTNLVALTKKYDRPKFRRVFEKLEEAMGAEFRTPNLDPEDEHEIYFEHGFDSVNGYTISFKENSKEFDVHQDMGLTLDPEDKASERAKFSDQRFSDDMVHDIAKEAMDDGMYIWSCDLHINGYTVGFSDPLRFTRISDEFVDDLGFEKLFDIARKAVQ